jgi:hypothetical protein
VAAAGAGALDARAGSAGGAAFEPHAPETSATISASANERRADPSDPGDATGRSVVDEPADEEESHRMPATIARIRRCTTTAQ